MDGLAREDGRVGQDDSATAPAEQGATGYERGRAAQKRQWGALEALLVFVPTSRQLFLASLISSESSNGGLPATLGELLVTSNLAMNHQIPGNVSIGEHTSLERV